MGKGRVYVTGGGGFVGKHLVPLLREQGWEVLAPSSRECNLLDFDGAARWLKEARPRVVLHAAAYYGGLGINVEEPANLVHRNTVMSMNLFEAAARAGSVEKIVAIGSACSYPGDLTGALREQDIWEGSCHASVMGYGNSKRLNLAAQHAYHAQHGIAMLHLILTNLYGPHDVYREYRSHVVAALIKKVSEAGDRLVCWGDGSPIREFMYVGDAADGIARAIDLPHDLLPINIGTGVGTTIRELTNAICEVARYKGEIVWDTSKPNGVAKKVLDVRRMKELLGWQPRYGLMDGLKVTIDWYLAHKESADARL
ncbi:MAG: NAD-dependent epimerase/dehydratase family protein [Acidobacteriota bacterium]